MGDRRGFILITTFIMMIVLTVMVSSVLFLLSSEIKDTGGQVNDYKLLALADAGVDRGYRALRDDYITNTQTGTADLRGNTASGTAGTATTRPYIRYYNEGSVLSMAASGAGTTAILQNFDTNYLNTRITNVKIGCRYAKSATGSTSPILTITYKTTAAFPDANSSTFSTTVPNSTAYNTVPFTTLGATVMDITANRTWTWDIINSANFQIRATASGSNNRSVNVDYLYLEVTYGIDTLTESWNNASYTALFPITLGSGTIQSAVITDEASKVHLNYASQALIQNLLTNLSIASASTKAAAVITYRGAALTNPFDSVEELQQVPGITASDYTAVKNYFTAYSFINTNSNRPTAARAPININTAPFATIKAIFDPLTLGAGDSTSLANDIIATRPFTCFYNSNSATDFFDFVNARAYLTATERLNVLNNADASILPPNGGTGTVTGSRTTEFCYASTAFNINSLARIGTRNFRVNTVRNSSGGSTFTNYVSDTSSVGWRAENFE